MNLLTARETAALLRCSTRQLYRLSELPDFPRRYHIGRSVRWESGEVSAWLRASARDAAQNAQNPAQNAEQPAAPPVAAPQAPQAAHGVVLQAAPAQAAHAPTQGAAAGGAA
jgi:predicted DNA-binding transcriptional regulator AlpA